MTRGRRKRAAARDRLSNLSDCLLRAILSQLRSRQAVETSALSRRWRHLWRAVPCIHIDSDGFPIQIKEDLEQEDDDSKPESSEQEDTDLDDDWDPEADEFAQEIRLFEAEEDALAKLEDFTDNLLFHRSLSGDALGTLRLRIHRRDGRPRSSNDTDMITRWIRRGLRLSPAALDIIGDGDPVELPCYFFNPGAGRLTKLHLENVRLRRPVQDILCTDTLPALEDLEIRNTVLASVIEWITSDALTNLTIVYESSGPGRQNDSSRSRRIGRTDVCITAPRLASLRLECPLAGLANYDFTLKETPCLAQASIRLLGETHLLSHWLDDQPDTARWLIKDLRRLLGSLCNVTSLHLSGFQEMVHTGGALPQAVLDEPRCVFPNLTSLVLDDCDLGDGLQTLWRFLHNTPALERLALTSCKWKEDPYGPESDEEQDSETATMVTSLKLMRIVHGNSKMTSNIKRKLPWATITK